MIGRWTLDEATALSFDVEPLSAGARRALEFITDPWGKQYKWLRELGRRAQVNGELPEVVAPLEYIRWAEGKGVPFPAPLKQMLEEASKPNCKLRTVQAGPADHESVILVRLAAALSEAFFQFDPQKAKSGVISQITGLIDLHPLPDVRRPGLDRDTVHDWLHYAARVRGNADRLLPPRVKGTFRELLAGMLGGHYGLQRPTAEELHGDLAEAGKVMPVEEIREALILVYRSV